MIVTLERLALHTKQGLCRGYVLYELHTGVRGHAGSMRPGS